METRSMSDKELGEMFNYYSGLVKSGQNTEENLQKLDDLYIEIVNRKLAKRPVWL